MEQVSSATTFSKKLANGAGKHVYDGVFGGSVELGSRVEDYREIFGGSGTTCSIPMLDVPELNERKVKVDTRSSKLEYSKIFGGFGDADFAVPYEELFAKPKKGRSSLQAETRAVPTEARSRPPAPEKVKFSEEKQWSLPDASFPSSDGVKQFNMLYNKTNQQSKKGSNGMTHVAKLHSVPGYARVIDEITPPQMAEGGGAPVRPVLNNVHFNHNVSEGIKEGKPQKKHVSGPQPRVAPENIYGSHAELRKKSSRHRSISNDMSFDAFEFGLDMHSPSVSSLSSPLPNLFNNKVNSNISMNSKFKVPGSDASESAAGNFSPPSFYEEVDANSVAALSAAAVRKAIEEAQEKIRIAKEIMERKREGLQQSAKQKLNNGFKTERKEVKTAGRANRSEEKETQEICEKTNVLKQVYAGLSGHNAANASQVTKEFRDDEKSSVDNNAIRETQSVEFKSTQVEHRLEKAEDCTTEDEFFDAIGTRLEKKATTLDFQWAGNAREVQSCPNATEFTEKMTTELNIKQPKEHAEKSKGFEEAAQQEKVEREQNSVEGIFEWNPFVNNAKSGHELHHLEEIEENTRVACEHEEADQTSRVSFEQGKCESNINGLQKAEEVAEDEILDLEESKDTELKEAQDWGEIEKKQRETFFQEEMENKSDAVLAGEETERKQAGICRQEENSMGNIEACERVECEKKQEQGWNQEENVKHQNDIEIGSEIENNLREVHEDEAIKMSSNNLSENEEKVKGSENLDEVKENDKILKEYSQENGAVKKPTKNFEQIGAERTQSDIHQITQDEKNMEATPFLYQDNNLEEADDVNKQDENESLGRTKEACEHEENFEGVELTAEILTGEEKAGIMEVNEVSFEPKWTGDGAKAVEEANDLKEEDNSEFDVLVQDFIDCDRIKRQIMDVSEAPDIDKNEVCSGETDLNHEHELNIHNMTEYTTACDQEKHVEERTPELDKNNEDVNESEVGTNKEYNHNSFVSSHDERWLGTGCQMPCELEKHVGEVACELVEDDEDVTGAEVCNNHEEHKNACESSHEDEQLDNGPDTGASRQHCAFEENGKTMEIPGENTSQSIDKKEKDHHNVLKMEESEAEKKLHRKNEEAKEREIAKEKERIAVERAIREARERAFVEAREKAEKAAVEKAAAEAQQRAEARARLDKASAGANNKLAAGKASVEAKLKAERAAVERATAEARERALERALSEKAASKVQQNKVPDRSSSLKSPNSSNDSVPCSTERSTGANSELAQSSKATSERDQRMAERAAKALAEKNMRDLLAQKEQAERNRLAETLDAEVKRWSSGKERNLRALLSTLQYILGSNSGWQPIPLTDLISTAAVRKAYRKATLFVHPDKLQQRGASMQQKYICEKVFDLLKEAWNKFSAEEK